MTEQPLTRALARQYLEAVVQSEIERLEAARWCETPPASTKEWRGRWMRERAEAYAFRLLASRGPEAELLTEDMDKLRSEGFYPPDMGTVAETLYELSDKYYRDRDPLGPNPADVLGRDELTEHEQMILRREAMKGAALARERLDRRQVELADRQPTGGDCDATPEISATPTFPSPSPPEQTEPDTPRYSSDISEILDRMDTQEKRQATKV